MGSQASTQLGKETVCLHFLPEIHSGFNEEVKRRPVHFFGKAEKYEQ